MGGSAQRSEFEPDTRMSRVKRERRMKYSQCAQVGSAGLVAGGCLHQGVAGTTVVRLLQVADPSEELRQSGSGQEEQRPFDHTGSSRPRAWCRQSSV